MKIAINESYGGLEVIKVFNSDIPKLSSDEVLVKVEAVSFNPKDILIRKGKFKRLSGKQFPQSIGFDFSGTIENSNKSNYKEGDKVFGMVNGWKGRTCAEYVNVSINEIYKAPVGVSFVKMAGIPLVGQTALQAIRDIGQLKVGQKICVNGASGGVGTIAIQIAKELGGVVTSISGDSNIEFCKSLGADNCLSYNEINIIDQDEKFDVFFDVFGNYSFKKTKNILTTSGKYITTVPKFDIFIEQICNLFRKKKARMVVVKSKSIDLHWLFSKLNEGVIIPVIDRVYEFDEIKEAQKHIESKRAKGKIIVKMRG